MRRFVVGTLLTLSCVLALLGVPRAQPLPDLKPTVILVSLDGWRWDYHQRIPAPNLKRLMARGVRAEALIPSFPSKTFPNHYTIVTGLYPANHGIIANNIWDDPSGRMFTLARREEVRDAMWWGGEPIWLTAEKAGARVSPLYWPGSEAPIGGRTPDPADGYRENIPADERVRAVLQRLDLPSDQRPTFISLYFEDVDSAGHADGPDAQSVRDATIRVDSYLGQLIAGLEQRGIFDRVNLVVVSDHGMSATSTERVVAIDDYVSLDDIIISDINPTLGIFPKEGKMQAVLTALQKAHPRLKVYARDRTPAHWHYRGHPRIPPIVGVVDDGWQVMRRNSLKDLLARLVNRSGGQHGYDPRARSMHGIFIATGPAFKQATTVGAFENVHIYNALAAALQIPPAKNDGDPAIARRLLR